MEKDGMGFCFNSLIKSLNDDEKEEKYKMQQE